MKEEVAKFISSGFISTILGYAVYGILLYLKFEYQLAMAFAYMSGYAINFALGKYWIFKNGAQMESVAIEVLATTLVTFSGFLLNLLIVFVLSDLIYSMSYYLSGLISIILVSFWNYWGRKKWVYN